VAAIEVSTDGGTTWHPATGKGSWSYAWTPAAGSATIKSRSVDDNGNLETPGAGVAVTVGWTISGTITGTIGVTVSLSGAATATATTDASGNYRFSGLANGSYTVTPAKSGLTFSPANQQTTVNGANIANVNFTSATAANGSISGTITGATAVTVTLTGPSTATTVTDTVGKYTFAGLVNGSYTVTPSKAGFAFNPGNATVAVNGTTVNGIDFTATAVPTWSISGTVTSTTGVLVSPSGAATATTNTGSSGSLALPGCLTAHTSSRRARHPLPSHQPVNQ
jgi:hypothetical protein